MFDGWLTAHTASTLFMVGLIWFVQIVHYPLFGAVGRDGFARYEAEHTTRTGWVVGPPMLVELTTAIALVLVLPGAARAYTVAGLVLVVAVWVATAGWSVPAHRRLSQGFDARAHRSLVRSNWVRTVGWSLRGVLALSLPRIIA